MFFRITFISVLVSLALLLGCSDSEESDSEEKESGAPGDQLVVYTYDAFPQQLEEMLTAHFAETYDVEVALERFQDTGGLYNEVFLSRDTEGADLVIGLDNTYVGKALQEGLFQPYRPEASELIHERLLVDESFRLVPFDYGSIVLNYDSEAIVDPPQTWEELLDPRFEESIVLMNPATSSPGRNFLLLTIDQFGEEGYLDFWRRLEPNILTITSGWSDGYGLYSEGEAPIVLSYETSPAYHIAYEDTRRYRNLLIEDVGYAQIEFMGIPENAPHPVNARRAVDFVLSEAFQTEIAMNQFMYPARDGIDLPEAFTEVERPSDTVFLDIERVDQNFDDWLSAWEETMR